MSQENVEIVREFVEAYQRGDFTDAVACLDPDVVYEVTQEGPTHGPDAVRAMWERWESDWQEGETVAEEFIDAGDQVFVTIHHSGRGRGNGIEVHGRFFDVFTLRDRKVVRKVEFTERSAALEAAGLKEQVVRAAELADRATARRVLVVGSPPPGGRDLDLLVRTPEEHAVARALEGAGYVEHEGTWARFTNRTADVVDLVPAASWLPGGAQLEALFDDARPLPGFKRLAVPAAHHDLLIAATRFLEPSGRLPEGRAARLAAGAATDSRAWSRARAEAPDWSAEAALRRLEEAFAGSPRRDLLRTARSAARRFRPLRPRGGVVALSGIDGSGKSTQALALADALGRLGYETAIEWTPLAGDRWLERIARPIKRALALVPALRPPPPAREGTGYGRGIVPNPGSELRRHSALVSTAWVTLVALANAWSHGRRAARHLAAGRIVIFDRYVLDSFVRLRFLYGHHSRFRAQRLLIAALSPRPRAAFYLEVDPAISLSRKADKWLADELESQAQLYREESERLGVAALDGRRAAEDLAAEIAAEVWGRLS